MGDHKDVTGAATFLVVLGLVLLTGVALAVLAFFGSILLFRLLGRISGLERLAELYATSGAPECQMHKRQLVAVGGVGYAKNADVCATPEGLYLWVHPFLSHYQPVLIPWGELSDPQPTMLRLGSAVRLVVGDPKVTTITLTQQLYESICTYVAQPA